jgi:hypothetical protein
MGIAPGVSLAIGIGEVAECHYLGTHRDFVRKFAVIIDSLKDASLLCRGQGVEALELPLQPMLGERARNITAHQALEEICQVAILPRVLNPYTPPFAK